MDQQTQWSLSRYGRPIKQLGGRYTLLHLLGRGGMADVCLARDEQNKRVVAAKVMIPDVFDSGRSQRFLRESEIAVSLHHQHIVHVYDYGDRVQTEMRNDTHSTSSDELNIPYLIMENIKGGSLKEWLEKRWLERGRACPLDEIVCIFEQLCAAVQYVYSKDMVHRDIKPANILFREHPQESGQIEVVLSDFGLAVAGNDTLSQPNAGTLAYMAPEQRKGDPQKASDIFSLGVVLYQLCTGHLPFLISDLALPLRQPWRPTLLNPSLPSALDGVILCALSNEPSQRFASASLFWQAVQSAVRQTPLVRISQTNSGDNHFPDGAQPAIPPSRIQLRVLPPPATAASLVGIMGSGPSIDNPDHKDMLPPVQEHSILSESSNIPAAVDIAGGQAASVPLHEPASPINPSPVELSMPGGARRITRKLPPSASWPGWPPPDKSVNPPRTPFNLNIGALAQLLQRVSAVPNHSSRVGQSGQVVPRQKQKPRGVSAATVISVIIIVIVFVIGSMAYSIYQAFDTATVTITPRVDTLTTTFDLTAKLSQNTIDSNAGIIPAQILNVPKSDAKSANTTGQVVSESDVHNLVTQIRPNLRSQIAQDIGQQVRAQGGTPIGDVVYMNETDTADPPVNTPSNTVTVTVSLQGTQEYIKNADVRTVASQKLQGKIKPNYTLIEITIQTGQPVVLSVDRQQGNALIRIAVGGVTRYTITPNDISAIQNLVAGKSWKEVPSLIAALNPNLDPNKIAIRVTYGGDNLPRSGSQINVTEADPSNMPSVQLPTI